MADHRTPPSPTGQAGSARGHPGDAAEASLDPPRPAVDRVTFGRLLEHGAAKHMFRPRAEISYFVRIETEKGERVFWSPALKAAMAISRTQPQVGDQIGIRENSILPVAVVTKVRDSRGSVIGERRLETPRTHWAIETREWYDERMLAADALRNERLHPREAVKSFPQLLPAYLALDSARRVAEERVSAANRKRFVSLVRETLAHAVERAMPLPALELNTSKQPQAELSSSSSSRSGKHPGAADRAAARSR